MMTLAFLATHALALVVLLLVAGAAGTLVLGPREGVVLRAALGLALLGQALFLLGLIGQLRTLPIVALIAVAIGGGTARWWRSAPTIRSTKAAARWLVFAPMFVLALHPPLAFDETSYHLSFIRATALAGELRFLPDLRYPVFPQLHGLLCVPMFLFVGDVATHLVSLGEVMITAALLVEWGRRRDARAGFLAAAAFLGGPIVVYLGTITYADAALMLFVTAGFYCLDRGISEDHAPSFALAGLFLGTAFSVKYLGGYFAIAALLIILAKASNRRRRAAAFAIPCAAAALPTLAWLVHTTGNPLFPLLPRVFGTGPWSAEAALVSPAERATRMARAIFDVTFARERTNGQPPFTPLFAVAVLFLLIAAWRDGRARIIALVVAGYLVLFSFLPQDARYLMPLLPLVFIIAADLFARRWPALTTLVALLAIAPGIAYAGYRLALLGMPPSTPAARTEMLARRIPEYRALQRAGSERVYACGAEHLRYYARGQMLGDYYGPWSYQRVLGGADGATLAERFRRMRVRYFLIPKRCALPAMNGVMELAYEDEAAQLWRVRDR